MSIKYKQNLFLILLFLFSAGNGFAQKNAFYESFTTKNSQWLTFEGNNLFCAIVDNDYYVHNKSASEVLVRTPFYYSRLDPIKLEMEVLSGDRVRGFNGFYIKTDKDLFKFYYSIQGYVKAVKINLITNKQDTLQALYAVDKINKSGFLINTVKFTIKKDQINFYINKQKVASAPFVAKKIIETGLLVNARNTMRVLDMKLSPRPRIYKINFIDNPINVAYKEPLNSNINTDNDEFAPVVSADGKWMFFVSQFRPESFDMESGRRSQDIYFSENINGIWTKAQRLPAPLNNEFANAVVGLSLDKKTMLLTGTYIKGNYYGDDVLYQSSYSAQSGWSFPEPISIKDFKNSYPFRSFCVSNDRKVLLMSGQQGESIGESDLYVSFLSPDNTYSAPKSLGKIVNTPGFENAPFLAADGKTLYFSSNGHVGFGKGDIFITKRLDDSWENWSIPLNLGASVNSPFDDSYFTVDGIGKTGYVCSPDGPNHEFNIYQVALGEGAKPEPVVVVTGKVINMKTRKPAKTMVGSYEDQSRIPTETTKTDELDGQYVFTLKTGSDYELKVMEQGFIPVSESLKLSNESGLKNVEKDIYIFPKEVGEKVRFRNINFGTGEFALSEEILAELDLLVKLLYQNPNLKISIEGHTDNIGSAEINMKLSKERAKKVAFYLYTQGLEAQRLSYKGFGESKPIADNKTELGRGINRRVEYVLY